VLLMHSFSRPFLALLLLAFASAIGGTSAFAFLSSTSSSSSSTSMKSDRNDAATPPCAGIDLTAHPSMLPGDPSLVLITNMDLGDKKMEVMKGKISLDPFPRILHV